MLNEEIIAKEAECRNIGYLFIPPINHRIRRLYSPAINHCEKKLISLNKDSQHRKGDEAINILNSEEAEQTVGVTLLHYQRILSGYDVYQAQNRRSYQYYKAKYDDLLSQLTFSTACKHFGDMENFWQNKKDPVQLASVYIFYADYLRTFPEYRVQALEKYTKAYDLLVAASSNRNHFLDDLQNKIADLKAEIDSQVIIQAEKDNLKDNLDDLFTYNASYSPLLFAAKKVSVESFAPEVELNENYQP